MNLQLIIKSFIKSLEINHDNSFLHVRKRIGFVDDKRFQRVGEYTAHDQQTEYQLYKEYHKRK